MSTCRCGLIGTGIGASLSPALHRVEAAHRGLALDYTLFDVDPPDTRAALGRLLADAERDGFAGLNITHPFKQQVIELLDHLSPQAHAIGAVNTVVFRDGRRHGHNTDAHGFTAAFRDGLPDAATGRVVQLGAGGAGAACAYAQLRMGAGHLTVVDPDAGRRRTLAASLARHFDAGRVAVAAPDDLPAVVAEADGVVNASPVGMAAHPGSPLPTALLRRGLWVVDIVYMPVETELLRAARAAGARAVGGAGMCVYQAAAAFRLFTGHTPDTARMLRHLDELLAERGNHHAA
ncbi:shikimate dehydrogenase [Virgisporangium aliadipatigenens]|uniref:Shikimate dehydrogenase (NADP(+)) n=1 Tax=Virgisporangium aliadipatigenens TaxID=741659 RepID=A0A8J3YRU7_9ACTN|nr:shikimate dehydrogenase [Virgisporangium aliadipatigenens]GIJ48681.1 shikimate dehydrogenase [Virgisporangium aliadipatigenens]